MKIYISSYNLETKEQSTTALSDITAQNNTAICTSNKTTIVPPVFPQGSPGWPSLEEGISPQYVFGFDDSWQEADPYIWGVCYIQVYWPNQGQPTRATAFAISDTAVATSAHCIYNAERGGICSRVEVSPSRDGNSYPFGTLDAYYLHWWRNFESDPTAENDYAVIELSESLTTGLFGWTTEATTSEKINASSYPIYLDNDDTVFAYYKQYKDSGYVNLVQPKILYTWQIDWTNGCSGGPIYNDEFYVVGIMSRGNSTSNIISRITKDVSDWFLTFRK